MIRNHRLNTKKLLHLCTLAHMHIVGTGEPTREALVQFQLARDTMYERALRSSLSWFRRWSGQTSNYKSPHQGAKECARRMDPNSAAYKSMHGTQV